MHRAVFTDGEHFDYLYDPQLPCRGAKGPCPYVGPATDDLVTMFFAKYLPPELWPNLPDLIPDNLEPPPLQLTPAQEFYAAGHLVGLKQFREDTHREVDISEEPSTDRVVPYVLNSPRTSPTATYESATWCQVSTLLASRPVRRCRGSTPNTRPGAPW